MPKLKLASAADSEAALSWVLLSPAATLKPRLPEALEPTSSVIEASLVSLSLTPTLPLIDWRLSMTAMAAESMSMLPLMVGSPLKAMSELNFRSFSRLTSTPWLFFSLRSSDCTSLVFLTSSRTTLPS